MKTIEVITEKLVPVEVPGDSVILTVLFRCDTLNRVKVEKVDENKSNHVSTSLLFHNGLLTHRAIRAPGEQLVPVRTVEVTKEVPVTVEVPVVEYKLNWYQQMFFYAGILAATGALVLLAIKFFIKK